MLEAHYAAPMIGAVLNPINIRLDAPLDRLLPGARRGQAAAGRPRVPRHHRAGAGAAGQQAADRHRHRRRRDGRRAELRRASSTRTSSPRAMPPSPMPAPRTSGTRICLLYTSGTTGNPKGAVYSHRGAYLGALANALTFKLDHESRYLWTLPMFHCSGWTFTWAVTAAGGTHVCLRKVEPKRIFDAIAEHRVTHMCGAPIVLNMLVHAPADAKRRCRCAPRWRPAAPRRPPSSSSAWRRWASRCCTSTAPPRATGPPPTARRCPNGQALPAGERYALMARQGVAQSADRADDGGRPARRSQPVPRDGATIGEIMLTRQHADEGLPQERGGDR